MGNIHSFEENGSWFGDGFFEDLFEIEDVADLTGLCYASSVSESFPAVICDSVLCGIGKATEHKIATYKCACSSFACITMNNNHILLIVL